MAEDDDLRKKIARCKRSLLVVRDATSIATLETMIRSAEERLAEIEQEAMPADRV